MGGGAAVAGALEAGVLVGPGTGVDVGGGVGVGGSGVGVGGSGVGVGGSGVGVFTGVLVGGGVSVGPGVSVGVLVGEGGSVGVADGDGDGDSVAIASAAARAAAVAVSSAWDVEDEPICDITTTAIMANMATPPSAQTHTGTRLSPVVGAGRTPVVTPAPGITLVPAIGCIRGVAA